MPAQDVVRAVQFQDVEWTGERFIAVAMGDQGGFFESTDGITWHEQEADPSWSPSDLHVADDGTLLATGRVGERTASWRSRDGLAWALALGKAAIPGADVAATRGGWVAVGTRENDGPCASYCPPLRGLAWTSPDGTTWTKAPRQASLEGVSLGAVIRYGNRWIAGGAAGDHAALWSSRDGRTWTRIRSAALAVSGSGLSGTVYDLAVMDSTLVAVGIDGGQDAVRARAWWSSDGKKWHAASLDRAKNSQIFDVAATGSELLATGPSGGCPGGIWSSADGKEWTCVARGKRIGLFGPYAAAASATIEVAVGLTDEGWDEESEDGLPGAIWWRERP